MTTTYLDPQLKLEIIEYAMALAGTTRTQGTSIKILGLVMRADAAADCPGTKFQEVLRELAKEFKGHREDLSSRLYEQFLPSCTD